MSYDRRVPIGYPSGWEEIAAVMMYSAEGDTVESLIARMCYPDEPLFQHWSKFFTVDFTEDP